MQLFAKLECDEVEILEHTQELLTQLGPEQPVPEGLEPEGGVAKDNDIADSDSEAHEDIDSQTMDVS